MKKTIAILTFLVISACTRTEKKEPAAPLNSTRETNEIVLSNQQYLAAGIELGIVEHRNLSGGLLVTGMLDVPPQNLANITAPFGGFLRSTTMLQGMRVTKGQVMAVIENPEYIQLQQDFLDSRSQASFLEAEYQRQVELARENVNAQKTLQKSLADFNSMKARNNGLRAKLKMLNLSPDHLDEGEIRSTIEIRAPITGYVTQVNASLGSFVNPTDVLFRIVDTGHLHAELTVFERDIGNVKIGQKIRFTLSNEAAERTATVFLIGREISSDRTVRVHGHLNEEDTNLIPGMYLKATIQTGEVSVPSLPEGAVLPFENGQYVFVRESDKNLRFKIIGVKTGIRENGYVEVHFEEKDIESMQIVVKGGHKLLSEIKNQAIE